jgi:hypothetical protein
MGKLADAALDVGVEVGIMPRSLVEKEIAHARLSDLRVVGSMYERKSRWLSCPMPSLRLQEATAPSRNFLKF